MSTPNNGISNTLGTGLIGHWDFDGNTNDKSGNSKHLEIYGNLSLIEDKDNISNRAYYNNATGDMRIISWNDAPTHKFSFSFWVRANNTTQITVLAILDGTTSNINYGWQIFYSRGVLYFYIGGNSCSATINLTAWTNVTITYDNQYMRMYANGSQITFAANIGDIIYTLGHIFVLGGYTSGARYKGRMDEVRFYNRLLTNAEIIEIYNIGVNLETNCKITYDGNRNTGGNAPIDNTEYTYGQTARLKYLANVISPNTPLIKDNFYFLGWTEIPDGIHPLYLQGETYAVYANVTLYARWYTASDILLWLKTNGRDVQLKWKRHPEYIKYDIYQSDDGIDYFKIGRII